MKYNNMRKNISLFLASISMFGATLYPSVVCSAVTHFDRGCELLDMGRWTDARFEMLKARAESPKSDHFQQQKIDYLLALCSLKLGFQEADDVLVQFGENYPQAPYQNDILFMRGVLAASNGDLNVAMSFFDDVDSARLKKSDREKYNIRMGYILFAKGKYSDSRSYLSKIGEESEYYPSALYCDSYIDYVEGENEKSKSGFERLKEYELFAPIVPYYLMQLEFRMGNYGESIEHGTSLLDPSSQQNHVDVIRTLAEAYFRMEQYENALELINSYEAAGGEVGREENYIKGFSLHQLGRYEQACEPLRMVCGADDEMTQNGSYHLANCYIHTGNKSGARTAFAMAANDKFNKQIAEEALFNYAKLQYELGDGRFNEAVNVLTRYVTTYDDAERLSTARTLLVAAYYNTRDYAAAYQNIALIKDPDSDILAAKQKISYLRGLEQFNNGNYSEAAKYLDESVAIGITVKQLSLAKYWLGEIDYLEGRYTEAIDNYNSYLARAPKSDATSTEALYSVGYAMLKQGNIKSALGYFERYVAATDGESRLRADSFSRIGDIYYGMRDFNAASQSYDRAIWLGGVGSNYARYQKAIIKGVQGQSSEKIAELKKITLVEGGEEYLDDALFELGHTYVTSDQHANAVETLKQFLEIYPTSPLYAQALSELGVAYVNMGDEKSSLEYYDRAIKAAPQSQIAKDAIQGIREIHVGRGDAAAYFKYAESIGMDGDINAVTRDSLSFASARGLYFAGDKSKVKLRSAADALSSYIEDYPKGYYQNDALFFLSDSYIKLGRSEDAIATLEKLSSRGRSQYSESLYSTLSKMCFEAGLYEKSAAASRNLYDVAKSAQDRHVAMSRYADATMMTGDEVALSKMSDDVLSLGISSVGGDAFYKAKYVRATSLRVRGERKEALDIYKELAKSDTEHSSEAQYYVIEDKFRNGDRESATDMIFTFAEQNNVDPYWLAKGFILLGDIYVADGDNFQARATYQSIVDGYSEQSDGVIDEAKQKISELK